MKNKQLIETIRRVIKQEITEASPAPSKPQERPGPAVVPGKPDTGKPKPRRPLGNPDVKPKPKATMNEAEMLAKIIKRFKSKKPVQESNGPKTWQEGYKEGYEAGFKDASSGKSNKFIKEVAGLSNIVKDNNGDVNNIADKAIRSMKVPLNYLNNEEDFIKLKEAIPPALDKIQQEIFK